MANALNTTESDILSDVIAANRRDLSPDVAKSVLKWKFKAAAVRRMNTLADKNRKGTITEAERNNCSAICRGQPDQPRASQGTPLAAVGRPDRS